MLVKPRNSCEGCIRPISRRLALFKINDEYECYAENYVKCFWGLCDLHRSVDNLVPAAINQDLDRRISKSWLLPSYRQPYECMGPIFPFRHTEPLKSYINNNRTTSCTRPTNNQESPDSSESFYKKLTVHLLEK